MANICEWPCFNKCNSVLLGLLWGSKSCDFVIFIDDFPRSLTFLSYLELFVLSTKSERALPAGNGFACVSLLQPLVP